MAVPMCGVPYHAAEGYISKLIRKGFKVAICEQMEDAGLAKKLVRREVTRVVTPGTAADSSLEFRGEQLSGGRGADRRPSRIRRSGSFHRRVSRHGISGRRCRASGFRKNCSSCGRKKFCMARRLRYLMNNDRVGTAASSRPAAQRAALASPRLRWMIGSSPPTTPFRCSKIISASCRSKVWACGQAGGGGGGGGHPLLRPLHAAWNFGPRGSHRLLRTPELPGARRGNRAQSGIDRAAVCGH